MFEKNPDLRGANEKIAMTQDQINEYIKCREDILHFAENYYYIQTIDYGRIKIPLWDFQKKMLKILIDPSPKRHVIVLSARQMSKTTVSALYLLHSMLFSKDCNIAILANNERTSREILSRIQMAYINLPLWLQKGIVEWNKGSMLLENGVKIIAASTSSNSIRGCTISTLFIDEASFVPQHIWDDFYMSVYPTVSSGKNSKIIMVSTPNGMNHFYDMYRAAVKGEKQEVKTKENTGIKQIEDGKSDEEGKESERQESLVFLIRIEDTGKQTETHKDKEENESHES
jgi:hypothetical protein